jgi:hypothetical protein
MLRAADGHRSSHLHEHHVLVTVRVELHAKRILKRHAANFHRRAGYLRSADPVFKEELEAIVEPDLVGASAATSVT